MSPILSIHLRASQPVRSGSNIGELQVFRMTVLSSVVHHISLRERELKQERRIPASHCGLKFRNCITSQPSVNFMSQDRAIVVGRAA
jgi:hypothetical protein